MKNFFSKRDYQKIAELFEIGTLENISYFQKGYQTPKVIVTSQRGKFVIAKHNLSLNKTLIADMKSVPRQALLHEIEFLNYLNDLPVPHYVQSRYNKYLENYKNFAVSVYHFLPGHQPTKITPSMAYQLGKFLGDFHMLGSKYKKTMFGRRKFYDLGPKIMAEMYLTVKKQKNHELKNVIEEIKLGVKNNRLPKRLPRGPVHVDIKPDNELFIGTKLSGVIDFGNTYTDTFIFDIGKTIMWNCLKHGKLDETLIRRFLIGYEYKRKLSKAESLYLQQAVLFAIYSHIWVDLYHVPIKYVPETYTVYLVKKFLPIAHRLEKNKMIV